MTLSMYFVKPVFYNSSTSIMVEHTLQAVWKGHAKYLWKCTCGKQNAFYWPTPMKALEMGQAQHLTQMISYEVG